MNAPHAARITDGGGTRKNTSQRRHGSGSSSSSGYLATSGPEGAHTQRNDRPPQTKRNYCRGTADSRSVVAGDDPRADPHLPPNAVPTTATPPPHSVGLPPPTRLVFTVWTGNYCTRISAGDRTVPATRVFTAYGLKISSKGQGETVERRCQKK